jgi:hypothetical protein
MAPLPNPVFLQTISDRLLVTGNDYSEEERLFQAGIPLVDSYVPDELLIADAVPRRKLRDALVRPILFTNVPVPSVSIVVPVYGGSEIFAECLLSISRQSFAIQRPRNVETIIVEDGVPEGKHSVFSSDSVVNAIKALEGIRFAFYLRLCWM